MNKILGALVTSVVFLSGCGTAAPITSEVPHPTPPTTSTVPGEKTEKKAAPVMKPPQEQPKPPQTQPAPSEPTKSTSPEAVAPVSPYATISFVVKTAEDKRLAENFTIGLTEKTTGKVIRKFAVGNDVSFSSVPPGTYTVSIDPIVDNMNQPAPFTRQSFDIELMAGASIVKNIVVN